MSECASDITKVQSDISSNEEFARSQSFISVGSRIRIPNSVGILETKSGIDAGSRTEWSYSATNGLTASQSAFSEASFSEQANDSPSETEIIPGWEYCGYERKNERS